MWYVFVLRFATSHIFCLFSWAQTYLTSSAAVVCGPTKDRHKRYVMDLQCFEARKSKEILIQAKEARKRGTQINILWLSTKKKTKTTKPKDKRMMQRTRQQNDGKRHRRGKRVMAEAPELKNPPKKGTTSLPGPGCRVSPFCLDTAALFPPPGRECK